MNADLVLLNANVITLDPSRPRAEAISVKHGRIALVGSRKTILSTVGSKTRTLDLDEKTVLPGFIDTHVHLGDFGLTLKTLNLEEAGSIDDVLDVLKARIELTPKGEWVVGRGWNEHKLKERRLMSRWDIDEASPDNPVYLHHYTCHATVLNSRGLEASGIDRKTKSPEGGWIDKDTKGEPTGFLRSNARFLPPVGLNGVRPRPNLATLKEAILSGASEAMKYGLTSIHVPSADHDELLVTQQLSNEGRLPIRVKLLPKVDLLEAMLKLGILSGFGNELLGIGALKIFSDGSLIARTAAMSSPYEGDQRNKGILFDQAIFKKQIIEAHKAGLQIAVHAVGDLAIQSVLNAYEEALRDDPRVDHRHRIEHGSVVPRSLREKLRQLGVVVSTQPELVTRNGDGFISSLGMERIKYTYPIKSLIEEGVVVSGSSDCPLTVCNPLKGIQSALTRVSENTGEVICEEQRISVDQAIKMYTISGAYVGFDEKIKGTIEDGKLADFTVLSRDPYDTPIDEICNIKVDMTIVGGRVVYNRCV